MNGWNTTKLMDALGALGPEVSEGSDGEEIIIVPFAHREEIYISPTGTIIDGKPIPELRYLVTHCTYGTPTQWDDGASSTDVELATVEQEWIVALIVREFVARRIAELEAMNALVDVEF